MHIDHLNLQEEVLTTQVGDGDYREPRSGTHFVSVRRMQGTDGSAGLWGQGRRGRDKSAGTGTAKLQGWGQRCVKGQKGAGGWVKISRCSQPLFRSSWQKAWRRE